MFVQFANAVRAQYAEMSKGELFVVETPDLADKYLAAFPPGSDPLFRKRTEHDCSCCKRFVRRLGGVVAIVNNQIVTIWDNLDVPSPYKEVAAAMREIVRSAEIVSVFRTKELEYGVGHNYDAQDRRYDHFHCDVAARHRSPTPDTSRGEKDAIFQVCHRGLTEIRDADLDAVLELIDANSLYRGVEHKPAIVGFRQLRREFQAAGGTKTFVWANLANPHARFRNTVIGTLLVDLAEGKDMDESVRAFEAKVAPMNYKRPTAVITQKMVEQAVQTLTDLGLLGALNRRYARLSDVSVNDVLFVSNESQSKMKDGITKLLEASIKPTVPDLTRAVKISEEDFLRDVLPGAKSLSVYLENRHTGNFVSLTGGDGPERMFKWDNNFAWSYDGDVTDSVKQRVKAAGGNINARLRVSLSWYNFDDLDLHCRMPGQHVYYSNKCGILDVDMNAGCGRTRTPVENLAFNHLPDGNYEIFVHQFSRRETIDVGFAIEFEIDGVLQQYSYAKAVADHANIPCFTLTFKNGTMAKSCISPLLTGGAASKEKWGVKTETLVPVSAVMYSPNHWGERKVGARHLIFALDGCKNPEPARGVYNEFLRADLDKHRKVFEVLGAKTKCQPSEDQISGVGFTSARGDSVTVVVDGRRSFTISF